MIEMSAADVAAHEAASFVRRPADRFLVSRSLSGGALATLADVPVNAPVTVTAQVAGMDARSGSCRMILADGAGNTLSVAIASGKFLAAYRAAGRAPKPGDRIQLRGHVTQQTPRLPKGVAGYAMRVVA